MKEEPSTAGEGPYRENDVSKNKREKEEGEKRNRYKTKTERG